MKIARVKNVKLPTRGTPKSAGLDFYVPNSIEAFKLPPSKGVNIPSGIKVEVPEGYMLEVKNKSGVALKKGLIVGACVIDEDYQGEVHLHVINVSNKAVSIEPGEKLVQMVFVPVLYAELEEVSPYEIHKQTTERGAGGFGSTGNGLTENFKSIRDDLKMPNYQDIRKDVSDK